MTDTSPESTDPQQDGFLFRATTPQISWSYQRSVVVPNSLLNVRNSISAIYQRQPFGGGSKDIEVITIKNKSTFHSEAKRRQDDKVLLIYTAGRAGECTKITYAAS